MKIPIGFLILTIGFVFSIWKTLTKPEEIILLLGVFVMVTGIIIQMATDWKIEYTFESKQLQQSNNGSVKIE